jgi:ribonuclease HI/exonuclease III
MNDTHILSIWQQNINKSLLAQLDMLSMVKKEHDIILIQEPHIDFKGMSRANTHYTPIYPYRHLDNHATNPSRSLILMSNALDASAWIPITIPSPDITAVQIAGPFGTIRIFNVYNDCKHNHALEAIERYMENEQTNPAPRQPVSYVWAGDFNRHHPLWDEPRNNHLFTQTNLRAAQPLLDLLGTYKMKMALPEELPTLQALATGNMTRVDNVFCSESIMDLIVSCKTQPESRPIKTDHFPIVTSIDIKPRHHEYTPRPNYRKVDWKDFREELQKRLQGLPLPCEITTLPQFHHKLATLEKVVQEIITQKVPMSKPSPRSKRWWTKELTAERRRVHNLGNKSYTNRFSENHPSHETYRCARNDYAEHLQAAKTEHWAAWLSDISEAGVWDASRLVTGPASDGGKTRVPALQTKDQATGLTRQVVDNEAKCEIFREAFFPRKPATTTVPEAARYPAPAWQFRPPNDDQITRAIQRMKPHKATKLGTVPNAVFLNNSEELVPHLGPIFRATFNLKVYPEHWAATQTLVLKKPGKPDYTLPNAWRPIVLSDGYARLLNSCLTEDVVMMCEKREILPANHFGGRPGRATTDALHYLVKTVKDAWRRGDVASLLSLDVKGAFPSTAVDRLLHNMRMRRIPGEIVEWMERRLEGRKTTLTFDDFTSRPFDIDNGLDQGDPFSQIAYIIYNADQLDKLSADRGEHGMLYIDDSNILVVAKDFEETHRRLLRIMRGPGGILQWAKEHNCEFGIEKFQLLDMTRRRQVDPNNPRRRIEIPGKDLKLGSVTIPSKGSVKILGVLIDRELRWKEQRASALKKGQDWMTQFARLSRVSSGIATRYMRQLYLAIAIPRMLYAAEIFLAPQQNTRQTTANDSTQRARSSWRPLASIQRQAAIMITGALRTTATDIIEMHANLLPFPLLVDKIRQRAATRLGTLPDSHPLSKAIINARKRRIKRHHTTLHDLVWSYNIEPDKMEKIGHVGRDAGWTPICTTQIAKTLEEAHLEDEQDPAEIRIYTDGSGFDGHVGAAAVLWRMGRDDEKSMKARVGKMTQHEVYEGEGYGLILGLELLKNEENINTVSIGVDNQAAIMAITRLKTKTAQHIFDGIHRKLGAIKRRNPFLEINIRWTPGHVGIEGNERADELAKEAATGDTTHAYRLPTELQRPTPYSKAAILRSYAGKIKKRTIRAWEASPRAAHLKTIDPTFVARKYMQMIETLPKKHSAILMQLRTGHVGLNAHLYRIKRANSPLCPCCRRYKETVAHFLLHCPAHHAARSTLTASIGLDARNIEKLLSTQKYLPHLFRYVAETERLRQIFGDIPRVQLREDE